ncbi:GNAT family N-acetyltransferase [Cesiribacter andamanensis]|uniref:N-acetyltransferase domain-containing protein n=1 Tax=Cesiribacter andamanensis AMV16 TaxID=1279009 RepID=M7NTM7_9BACT|nr:GNAT family N-acetyltransferase [Cesiribacter andamanensis]EMR01809.1 hypothetical protein ADICEAN_03073 [Cesiribacter andamanensis AMV16]
MEHSFKEITHSPASFFSILPPDWQEGIVPHWSAYEQSARIFVLEADGQILGGGIVFSSTSPDTHPTYLEDAQRWFAEGYLYIGFLWISEQYRDKQLGSAWLQQLYDQLPLNRFWLAIEDYRLANFYRRNGFTLIEELTGPDTTEWVLAMHGKVQVCESSWQVLESKSA